LPALHPIAVERAADDNSIMPASWEPELEADQQRLRDLATTVTLEEFLSRAKAMTARWEAGPGEAYGQLALAVCDLLCSAPYSGNKQAQAAAWTLAADTIERKQFTVSVPVVVSLLYHSASEPVSERNDWPAVRRERARWWLETWNRLDQAFDKHFNPKHVPETSDMPADESKAESYRQQVRLRHVEPLFKQTAVRYLVQLYALPPKDADELTSLVTAHLSTAAVKAHFENDVPLVDDDEH